MNQHRLDPSSMANLAGFGMAKSGDHYWIRPWDEAEIGAAFETAKQTDKQIVLRGAGRSYGDANIAREQICLDLTRMNQVREWDPSTGRITVGPGATIETLWRVGIEDGWWPPVVSGTMFPTIGGVIGMNIHGKNNPRAGTFGEHVLEANFLCPNGERLVLTPQDDLFYDFVSSAGLLGTLVQATMQLKRVATGNVRVVARSITGWQHQIETFEEFEPVSDYLVSWIDCFGRGNASGRGEFHAASYIHSEAPDRASMRADRHDLPDTLFGLIPKSMMWRAMKPLNNRLGMKAINAAKHYARVLHGNGKQYSQGLVAFNFLLDYVPGWKNAYLPGGLIQYQSFVPKEHALEVFREQVQMQQAEKLESFLGVMKRHRPDRFLFSHGVDGYSLALDFKVETARWKELERMCHRMNDLVLAAGGRFYLAKDATLRPQDFAQSIGEESLARYSQLKAKYDPQSVLTSDLAKRLGLDPRA